MKEVDPVETVLKARRIPGCEYQGEWPANPADYIEKARSTPGVEYQGDCGREEEGYCKERPDRAHCDCWWDGEPCCACWYDGDNEEERHQRYLQLHAGRSILLDAQQIERVLSTYDPEIWRIFRAKLQEIEREIEEVKR